MKKQWFIAMAAVIATLGSLAFIQARGGDGADDAAQESTSVEMGPEGQPIAFPHDRHAGDFGIDCQYCHFSAERSRSAGIPPVATCMGCHTFVAGSENPEEVATLRSYWEQEEAIPWNRIYRVPDHVFFPHMRHVAADVECAACHGNVEEIGVIQEVNQPLTMGWCVGCHIESDASRDCTACHY